MKSSSLIITAFALGLLVTGATAIADEQAHQKAVLVTGASSGIGLRIATTLADNGYHVYAGARKAEDLERLDTMDNISSVRLDVTVQDEIDAAVEFVESEGRGLWGIVNNAGVVARSPLASGPEADVRFTFDVNVFGPFRINQAFLPLVTESGGRTTAIGSISGFIAGPGSSYSMSKFALEGYTDSLAQELESSGVHVSIVDPGSYKSRIREKVLAQILASADAGESSLGESERAEMIRTTLGNDSLQEPDDVANTVLEIMSSDSPRRRYMVTSNEQQARATLTAAMVRLLELNEGQPYSYDRDQLVELLDELLQETKTITGADLD